MKKGKKKFNYFQAHPNKHIAKRLYSKNFSHLIRLKKEFKQQSDVGYKIFNKIISVIDSSHKIIKAISK